MAIKADEKAQMAKDVADSIAKAEATKAAKEKANEPTPAEFASKFAKSLEMFSNYASSMAKEVAATRFKLIQAENEYRSIKLKVAESEKRLASLESKAQLALQSANSGVRALSDRLDIERGANADKEERLKAQERTLQKSLQEAEEMKAMYEAKLKGVESVLQASPGN